MSALYIWLATAWDWLTGLRISTRSQRQVQADLLAGAEQAAHRADLQRERAEREKREAQRILAILSEPLKDWDLADFPSWATNPDRSKGLEAAWPMLARERAHVWELVQAYKVVRREAAQARMSVTTNDMLRGRTWGDEQRQAPRPPRPVRNLP